MKINSENIDELMFQLLEGEIQGEERIILLEAIEADKDYRLQWQAWQNTVLNPNEELLVMPVHKLLKKSKIGLIVMWKYAAAAVVVLTFGFGVFYSLQHGEKSIAGSENRPKNPKLEIIKVPNNEPVGNQIKEKDTTISFKQKIQMMAQGEHTNIRKAQKGTPETDVVPMPYTAQLQDKKEIEVSVKTPDIEQKKATEITLVSQETEENNTVVTSYSESIPRTKKTVLKQEISEKKSLLARIFSKPQFKLTNDSANFKNRKLIIENKQYKIIAGF